MAMIFIFGLAKKYEFLAENEGILVRVVARFVSKCPTRSEPIPKARHQYDEPQKENISKGHVFKSSEAL